MKNLKATSALITKVASLFIIIAGVLALAGWFFDIPSFKSLMPGIITIKFNTAVCIILSGFALFLLDTPSIGRHGKTTALVCSWIVLLMGLLTLSEYVWGYSLGIDELLWREGPGTVATLFPGRMSLTMSLNFTLLGIIFLMLGKKKYHWPIEILLIIMIPVPALVILNHIFGASFLSSIRELNNTALSTAILFIVLCLAILFSQGLGYMHFSFINKIVGFFILMFLVRSIIFFAINKNNALGVDNGKWVTLTHKVISLAEDVNEQSGKIQSETWNYIITGDEKFPRLFNSKTNRIINTIGDLRSATAGNVTEQLLIDTLQKQVQLFIRFQHELVDTRQKEGFVPTQKILLNGNEEFLLNSMYSLVTAIEREESHLWAKRKTGNEQIVQNSSRLLSLFQVIAVLLFLLGIGIIYKNSKFRNKTEEDLQKSLKELSDYKYALDESSIVATYDEKGIIMQVNDNFCKISQYKREELIGQDYGIINSDYHSNEFARDPWTTIINGEIWRGELKKKAKDGSYFWLDTTIVPFMGRHGKPYQYLAIRFDITERKELEEQIRKLNQQLQRKVEKTTSEVVEKEQQYRFLLQNMKEGVEVIGYDWVYLFVNNSIVEQHKYSNKELVGHSIIERYPGVENTQLFKELQRCMKGRNSKVLENEFSFQDGIKRWFELSIQPVPEGLFILSMDITERKKAEQKLMESLKRYELINKATGDAIWEWDLDTNELIRNNTFTTLYGYPANENTTGRARIFEDIHPADKEGVLKTCEYCIKNNLEYWQYEYRFRAADGSYRSVYDRAFVEFDEKGKPRRMIGAMTDLTEKKRLERELAEQKLTQQKMITEVAMQAQEKEKNELGRELHDNVNQILATVKIYLGMVKSGQHTTEDLTGMSYEYVTQAMEEIRKLSHSLVAPSLGTTGLEEALEELLEDTNFINNLQVRLVVDENFNRHDIDKNKQLMLYRIVQEQLNNILKHAQAKHIVITLKLIEETLLLSIADDGTGFDAMKKSKGIGLKNISSRVEFYSGNMNIISTPGKGCTLNVSVPLYSSC
jgi:two-component system sensor histidine kinase UhpB